MILQDGKTAYDIGTDIAKDLIQGVIDDKLAAARAITLKKYGRRVIDLVREDNNFNALELMLDTNLEKFPEILNYQEKPVRKCNKSMV